MVKLEQKILIPKQNEKVKWITELLIKTKSYKEKLNILHEMRLDSLLFELDSDSIRNNIGNKFQTLWSLTKADEQTYEYLLDTNKFATEVFFIKTLHYLIFNENELPREHMAKFIAYFIDVSMRALGHKYASSSHNDGGRKANHDRMKSLFKLYGLTIIIKMGDIVQGIPQSCS